MTRIPWVLAALLASAPIVRCADTVQIADVGVKGYYYAQTPTAIRVLVVHSDTRQASVRLTVRVRTFTPGTQVETVDTFSEPLTLTPNEHRIVDIPVLLRPKLQNESVEVQEISDQGALLANDHEPLELSLNENLITLLCADAKVCHEVQSQITFSGTAAEQAQKGKVIKFVAMEYPVDEWWAYSPSKTVVLARRASELTAVQRDALEGFVRAGGALIVIEDQAQSGAFLEPYRTASAAGAVIGYGKAFWIPRLTGKGLGELYAGRDLARAVQGWRAGTDDLQWARHRLATHFRFPTLWWLLIWLGVYILVAGALNFAVLRKLDRREWGWVTLPSVAILFACAMYFSSAWNRPHELRAEDIAIRWMDDSSSVAYVEHGERILSNRRVLMRFSMKGHSIFEGDRNGTGNALSLDMFRGSDEGNSVNRWNVEMGASTNVELPMPQWSFRDLEFSAIVNQPGTVRLVDSTHLRNETGTSFRQAMYLDQRNVYFWDALPEGAEMDLGAARKTPLGDLARGQVYAEFGYPTQIADYAESMPATTGTSVANEMKNAEAQLEKPFDLTELIRAWPPDGGNAFHARSGVFFGLSSEEQPPIALTGQQFTAKGYSITIVSLHPQNATEHTR